MRQTSLITIAILIALGTGILVGTKISKKAAPQSGGINIENTYQSGWEAAMQAVEKSNAIPSFPEEMEIKNITGTVQSISNNILKIKVTTPGFINSPSLTTRDIIINADTKIVQLMEKDLAQIQKEMKDFNAEVQAQKDNDLTKTSGIPVLPGMQDMKNVTVNEIKAGQIVTIQANEDIRKKQQFNAVEVRIQADMKLAVPKYNNDNSTLSQMNTDIANSDASTKIESLPTSPSIK